ncbi:hypothetical protein vseg_001849 [Gypsophila vaccaria]
MSDDFSRSYPNSQQRVQELAIRSVEQYLEAMSKTLANFGLEHLAEFEDEDIRRTQDIFDALDVPIR